MPWVRSKKRPCERNMARKRRKLIILLGSVVDKGAVDQDNMPPFGGVPEWPKGSDCKSDARASVVRIHPPPPCLMSSTGVIVGMGKDQDAP